MPKAFWFLSGFLFALLIGIVLVIGPLAGSLANVASPTDDEPSVIEESLADPQLEAEVSGTGLRWLRQGGSGGLLGACSRLEIDDANQLYYVPCGQGPRLAYLTSEELDVLAAFMGHLAPFEYAVQEATGNYANATVHLSFYGQGNRQVTLPEQAELAAWAEGLFMRVMGQERRADLVAHARLDLAGRLGISIDAIVVSSMEPVVWPDACLGLREDSVACTRVPAPGYRIVLSVSDEQHEYRADEYAHVKPVAGHPEHMIMPPVEP